MPKKEFNLKLTEPQNAVDRLRYLFNADSSNSIVSINEAFMQGQFFCLPIVEGCFEMIFMRFEVSESRFLVNCLPEFDTKCIKILVHDDKVQVASLTQENSLTFDAQASPVAVSIVCERNWLKLLLQENVLGQMIQEYYKPQPLSFDLQHKINLLNERMRTSQSLSKVHFYELGWTLLENIISSLTIRNQAPDDLRIRKVLHLYQENIFGFPPSLKEIACQLDISSSKLKQLFRQSIGEPPYAYYKKMKMSRALEMLNTGKYNVNQISTKLGYASPIKFITAFKSIYNKPPGMYIRRKK